MYLSVESRGSKFDAGLGNLQLGKTDWRQLRPMVCGMIAEAFGWYQFKFQTEVIEGIQPQSIYGPYSFNLGFERDRVLEILNRWSELLLKGDIIISFNWDLLHEAHFWRAGKWHYADGYGFTCSDAPKKIRSPIKILKLHGSVNWAQQDEQDEYPAIEHKKDFFSGTREKRLPSFPNLAILRPKAGWCAVHLGNIG
jgi:hypothetical protein